MRLSDAKAASPEAEAMMYAVGLSVNTVVEVVDAREEFQMH